MTERDDAPEGWHVRQRVGFLAAVLAPALLLVVVAGAGLLYARRLEPGTHRPIRTFPAPGVETFIHDGAADPPRARSRARIDPAVEAAKRAVLANGAAGWRE